MVARLKIKSALILTALGALAFAVACGGGGSTVSFSFDQQLPVLEQGDYEVWGIFGEEKVSVCKFDGSDGDNNAVECPSDRNLRNADRLVITIEPENDTDPEPSGIVILEGPVTDGNQHPLTFPVDFKDAAGSYILKTPTSADTTDDSSGIWFLQREEDGQLAASLTLPALPPGWIYEGWAVHRETPLSTGRFSTASGADDFSGFSGTDGDPAPPFPGEDFVMNAPASAPFVFPINLADGASDAVISVEPDLNGTDPTGPDPFLPKPLKANIRVGAFTDFTSYPLDLDLFSIPGADATIG